MKSPFFIFIIMSMCIGLSANATSLAPGMAIANVKLHCGDISDYFASMKTMAQVNTAITGVGTAVGVGATAVGLVKADVDKTRFEKLLNDTRMREQEIPSTKLSIDEAEDFTAQVISNLQNTTTLDDAMDEREKRSRNLGNWRTGLLAGNAATHIAATVIAAKNHTSDDLKTQLNKCIESIHDLQDSAMQAKVEHTDSALVQKMENIVDACRDYEMLDVSKIDNKAKGATISSGIGAAVSTAGTITSATANSDKIRDNINDTDHTKEKNLNTASNVLAAGATVASGVATAFNAKQISTIRKAQDIATKCSEALNQ